MPELHFQRIRAKDTSDPFIDPKALIQEVYRQAVYTSVEILKAGDPKLAERLEAIYYVFYTRLEEDSAPLEQQIAEFEEQLNKLDVKAVLLFRNFAFMYITYTFALHTRRDTKMDKQDGINYTVSNMSALLLPFLHPDTASAVKDQLSTWLGPLLNKEPKLVQVDAICQETGEKLLDIKLTAARAFTDGELTWENCAKACDEYWQRPDAEQNKAIACALAYPTYEHPTATIGVNTDENK